MPFLQVPWPMIRQPASSIMPLRRVRRTRAWRVSVREPSRYVPRNPLAWADVVSLHPVKGMAGVLIHGFVSFCLPALAPLIDSLVWLWAALFSIGLFRQLRLLPLRSTWWKKLEASLRAERALAWLRRSP